VAVNNLRKLSDEERAEIAAKYAKYAAEAAEHDKLLGLTNGDAENSEEPSHTQAQSVAEVDTTTPISARQKPQEPIIGEVERAFFNNLGYPPHGPRRYNDTDSGWRTPPLPGEDRGGSGNGTNTNW